MLLSRGSVLVVMMLAATGRGWCGWAAMGDWPSVLHHKWAAGDLVHGYAAVLYRSG